VVYQNVGNVSSHLEVLKTSRLENVSTRELKCLKG
jgi:hypothetical protein